MVATCSAFILYSIQKKSKLLLNTNTNNKNSNNEEEEKNYSLKKKSWGKEINGLLIYLKAIIQIVMAS